MGEPVPWVGGQDVGSRLQEGIRPRTLVNSTFLHWHQEGLLAAAGLARAAGTTTGRVGAPQAMGLQALLDHWGHSRTSLASCWKLELLQLLAERRFTGPERHDRCFALWGGGGVAPGAYKDGLAKGDTNGHGHGLHRSKRQQRAPRAM